MPLPKWLAHINKRFFNKLELKRGKRPVLRHLGRASGTEYSTPMDAHSVEGGFVFFPLYGPDSDWVRNVLADGRADLSLPGEIHHLVNPRLISKEAAWELVEESTKPPPDRLNVTEYLRMDLRR